MMFEVKMNIEKTTPSAGIHLTNIPTQVSLPLKQKLFDCLVDLLSVDFENT
jgi:hypothetical protein